MNQFHNKKDSFLVNMGLNHCKPIFLIDFLSLGNKEEEFEPFFKNVFKDKINLIRC